MPTQTKIGRIKKILYWIIAIAFIAFLFRGPIFRFFIHYKPIGERAHETIISQKLMDSIDAQCMVKDTADIHSIIIAALDFTAQQLQFTDKKCDLDPNRLSSSQLTNCIGYSAFFTSTLIYLLGKHHFSDKYEVSHKVGHLYIFDFNIHILFKGPFFKDHDFVTIQNQKTGQLMAVDPTIADYLLIDFVEIKN